MRIDERPTPRMQKAAMISAIVLAVVMIGSGISLMMLLIQSVSEDVVSDHDLRLDEEPIQTREIIIEETVEFEQDAPLISEDDLMAKVVMAEAGWEPFVGKVAVAAVILNRAEMYEQTIYEVLTAPNQFAKPAYIVTEDCYKAVEFAKENRDLFPTDMIYFRNKYYHKDLGYPYIQIGGHYFSTEEKHEEGAS